MKLLITGICGFVGSTLAKRWLESESGLAVYGLDNLIRPGSEENRIRLQKSGIKFVHGDIRTASDFEGLPTVDWVIDAAANPSVLAGIDNQTSSRQLIEHNLLGTVNMLEYCKRCGAGFILLSTSRVYSINELSNVPVEEIGEAFQLKTGQPSQPGLSQRGIGETFSTAPPISLYGCTKLASENLALEYGDAFGFPVWINRCGVLAGAGQFGRADQGIFAFWINAWMHRRPLTYIGFGGKGYQVRDFMHPRDLVPLLMKQTAASSKTAVRLINLGGGTANAMSLAQLSTWCRNRFGSHTVSSNPELRRFDIPWVIMDSALALQTWNWQPQTASEVILQELAAHAESHPNWLEFSDLL
jgi:CDP-paratose 2-epimerase